MPDGGGSETKVFSDKWITIDPTLPPDTIKFLTSDGWMFIDFPAEPKEVGFPAFLSAGWG